MTVVALCCDGPLAGAVARGEGPLPLEIGYKGDTNGRYVLTHSEPERSPVAWAPFVSPAKGLYVWETGPWTGDGK